MKIGFLKYGVDLRIDCNDRSSSSGGARARSMLIDRIIESGSEVTLLSEVRKCRQEHLQSLLKKYKGKLKYAPYTTPKLDAIMVEGGTDDIRPADSRGIPHLVRTNEVFAAHEGVCFFWNSSLRLRMCFLLEGMGQGYRDKGWLKIAPSKSLTKNKIWIFLTRAGRPTLYRNEVSTSRAPFQELRMPTVVFNDHFLVENKSFPLPKEPPADLIYIANQKPRIQRFEHYYGKHSNRHPVEVVGSFKEDFIGRFPKMKFSPPVFQGDAPETYTRGKATIYFGDERFIPLQFITPRFWEGVSGTVTLMDEDFDFRRDHLSPERVSDFPEIPKELLVSRNSDAWRAQLKEVISASRSTREGFRESLLDQLKRFNKRSRELPGVLEIALKAFSAGNLFRVQHTQHKRLIEHYKETH